MRATRMLLTADLIDGLEARDMGLVIDAVPQGVLDNRFEELADRIRHTPTS